MPLVTIRLAPYMDRSSEGPSEVQVSAKVAGDLAVHRYTTIDRDGTVRAAKTWTVTHLPTMDSLGIRAMPDRFTSYGGITAGQRELLAWAAAWQAACPAFFAAARVKDQDAMRAHVSDAIAKGRAL